MLARSLLIGAALASAAMPARAADLNAFADGGARRSGAVVGGYFRVPLQAARAEDRRLRAGLRLAMTHDYRTPTSPNARFIQAESIDLRLTGPEPTLYLAGRAVTGGQAKLEASEGGGGRLDKIMIGAGVALAAVAGFFVVTSLD